MPAVKKPTAEQKDTVERAPAMCDNHPDVRAAHTTTSTLHQPISLCARCLRRVEHLRQR